MSSTHRNTIQICRVYTPPPIKEGVWILIDRLWPRGLKKDALAFDLWLKDITPSVSLRQWFHGDSDERWNDFVDCYIEELDNKGDLIERILEMAREAPITLFYAAKEPKHNHALVLQAVLYSWPNHPDKTLLF
ncbi:TPA: DUF488 domain-containing protein [Legionella pneumophila]|uniref:DUF488 domain-containing protein n=1 Tax=Legionella pneumophila TaxID=446 RepID=UPI002244EC84|nr:DUF488 family protein [Legionella pneumophila]MCW8405756.1 DUF488 family protein [Legionella pneumophila]HEL9664694.1 DUF488 family protein [Legionella pneumophila]HEN4742293.1 DUF488 family protein [Legionella pneumophila]HEN5466556.1 DUF488 family protein [Legionella pneumophila]